MAKNPSPKTPKPKGDTPVPHPPPAMMTGGPHGNLQNLLQPTTPHPTVPTAPAAPAPTATPTTTPQAPPTLSTPQQAMLQFLQKRHKGDVTVSKQGPYTFFVLPNGHLVNADLGVNTENV